MRAKWRRNCMQYIDTPCRSSLYVGKHLTVFVCMVVTKKGYLNFSFAYPLALIEFSRFPFSLLFFRLNLRGILSLECICKRLMIRVDVNDHKAVLGIGYKPSVTLEFTSRIKAWLNERINKTRSAYASIEDTYTLGNPPKMPIFQKCTLCHPISRRRSCRQNYKERPKDLRLSTLHKYFFPVVWQLLKTFPHLICFFCRCI